MVYLFLCFFFFGELAGAGGARVWEGAGALYLIIGN